MRYAHDIVEVNSFNQRSIGRYFFCSLYGVFLTYTEAFAKAVLQAPDEGKVVEPIWIDLLDCTTLPGYECFSPHLARFLLAVLILQDRFKIGRPFVPILDQDFLNVIPLNTGVFITVLWDNDKWNLDLASVCELKKLDRPIRLISHWIFPS